jgi:hypothetical protein
MTLKNISRNVVSGFGLVSFARKSMSNVWSILFVQKYDL